MHVYFERLKQRLDALNQLRVDRALDGMPSNFQLVYQLIPLFLHYHHPAMPGFLQHGAPHEIALFFPSSEQIDLLLAQVDSLLNDPEFSYETFSEFKRTPDELTKIIPPGTNMDSLKLLDYQAPIIGVYSMGSTSYLGQNRLSDLDLWICHQTWLSEQEVEQLAHKCSLLEDWAGKLGVRVSLFLVGENRFRHSQSGNLDDDDCGTSQHYLLLDEFYRSAVRLAGKRLLWYMIPSEHEAHYDEYVTLLYSQGILVPNEWLDLGSVGALSAKEYFGSSLWQLYKSIDSPYKAVLKSLLLEAYSFSYPDTILLAVEIKQHLHRGEIISSGLDAYILMLRKISDYLIKNNDFKRLQLLRRCLYLKVNEDYANSINPSEKNLSDVQHNWRRNNLQQLVQSWGWSEQELSLLNGRQNWKIEQVRPAFDEILVAIMESYRNLIHFARRHNVSVSASPQDIGILTRKLYAAYEQLPGKITLINPQISPDLSEENITFLNVRLGSVNRSGWYLFNRAPVASEMFGRRTIEYNLYLSKLIVWSYINGLMTEQTKIYVRAPSNLSSEKITQCYQDIRSIFPQQFSPATPTALYSPAEIDTLAILVNLESDPTQDEVIKNNCLRGEWDVSDINLTSEGYSSVLNYGEQQVCLVGSIDFVYLNSWNELRTLHFIGQNAVIDALKTLLSKMHQFAAAPKIIKVFTYSEKFKEQIAKEIKNLFIDAIHLRLLRSTSTKDHLEPNILGAQPQSLRSVIQPTEQSLSKPIIKMVNVAGIRWGLFFERLSVTAEVLESGVESYSIISDYKLSIFGFKKSLNRELLKTKVDNLSDVEPVKKEPHLPELIESYACEGIIQFFFQPIEDTDCFNTYILDERNEIEIYADCEGSQEDLVKDVSRFYSASHDRFTSSSQSISFNLPQFYTLTIKNSTQMILPFRAGT